MASGKGGVSPVDLGIGMLVLYELAHGRERSSLTLADYRFAGGSQGLLTGYLLDRLNRFPEVERSALLKGLLHLVDLASDQRIAEGRSLGALAEASALPRARLESYLGELIEARLLEKVGGETYRLQHERIIPPLRQLTGTALAEEERARLTLQEGYRRWLRQPGSSRLLAGADLKLVLRHRNKILTGEMEESDFLRRSRGRQLRRRAMAGLAAALAFAALLLGQRSLVRAGHEDFLANWKMPRDLYTRQAQLKTLRIHREITNLRWLRAPLRELEVRSQFLTNLEGGLPTTLMSLDLSWCGLQSAVDLPPLPRLETLKIGALPRLKGFPRLRVLDVSSSTPMTSLAPLADFSALRGLKELHLVARLPDLRGFPVLPELETLSFSAPYNASVLSSLSGLPVPTRLKTLDLSSTALESLAGFPRLGTLETLNLDEFRWSPPQSPAIPTDALPVLPRLKQLSLRGYRPVSLASLARQPSLETLDLRPPILFVSRPGSQISMRRLIAPASLPRLKAIYLMRLDLPTLTILTNFPRLETVALEASDLPKLAILPTSFRLRLKSLDVYGSSPDLPLLAAFPNLQTLSLLSAEELSGFPSLPRLRTLRLPVARRIQGLPALPALETLDLSRDPDFPFAGPLTSLQGFPSLPRLRVLNLRQTDLFDLTGLPALPRLESFKMGRRWFSGPLIGLPAMPRLKRLALSGAGLPSPALLKGYPALEELDLSRAGLRSLSGFPALARLRSLDLSGNELKDLAGLPPLSGLKVLHLYDTQLDHLQGLPPSVEELAF